MGHLVEYCKHFMGEPPSQPFFFPSSGVIVWNTVPERVGKARKTPFCPLANQFFLLFLGLYQIFAHTHTCISIVFALAINGYKYLDIVT